MKIGISKKRIIIMFLVIIFVFNFIIVPLSGKARVEAGFWDNNKDNVLTVVKGIIMFWIIRLMTQNSSGDDSESFLTSTIKKGLNIEETEENDVSKVDNKSDVEIEILQDQESKVVELINQSRKENNFSSLESDKRLEEVARVRAKDLVNNNYFSHESPEYGTPFNLIKEAGIEYVLAGENLAGAATIEKAFEKLMDSPEHRSNILDPRYDRVGIGIVRGGPYGLTVVQLFIDSPLPEK